MPEIVGCDVDARKGSVVVTSPTAERAFRAPKALQFLVSHLPQTIKGGSLQTIRRYMGLIRLSTSDGTTTQRRSGCFETLRQVWSGQVSLLRVRRPAPRGAETVSLTPSVAGPEVRNLLPFHTAMACSVSIKRKSSNFRLAVITSRSYIFSLSCRKPCGGPNPPRYQGALGVNRRVSERRLVSYTNC